MISTIPLRVLPAFLFSLVLASAFGLTASRAADEMSRFLMSGSFARVPAHSDQLLVVTGNTLGSGSATVKAFEKGENRWTSPFPPADAVIGRNGFARPGAKREGDGKTPSGIYPLILAFGYDGKVDTRMPYREVTENDLWVDDPEAQDYNKWVRRGETKARSFEELRRKDGLYRYGLVIGYNTDPVAAGRGSAIFLHVWKGRSSPTSGCVAMAEQNVLHILKWLDPAKKPLIIMGTRETVLKLTE